MPRSKTSRQKPGDDHQISFLPTAEIGAPSAEETPLSGGSTLEGASNSKTMMSRRTFLYGAAAVGVVAAAAGGVAIMSSAEDTEEEVTTLEVAEDQVFSLDDCTELNVDTTFHLVGEFSLPYGSLVWANDDAIAACLLPTDTPSPLTRMALLNLSTGDYTIMIDNAVGSAEGFEIYDVRTARSGMVWTEANIFEGRWRVYSAPLNTEYSLGQPTLLEEGNQNTETPSLAAVGESAFWQVMPHMENENARTEPFSIKQARFGSSDIKVVYESIGRAIAPLYACSDGIAATPRISTGERYWELIHILESTRELTDRITLPNGMQPSAVGWGSTGFAFCFDNIYDYGDGISNLGTYTPANAQKDISEAQWFRFGRTPLASPAWCNQQWFVVKSTQAICPIDVQAREYCALDVDDASDDWGDYLATSGTHSTFVTYAHLDSVGALGEQTYETQVRVWEPYPADERAALEAEFLAQQAAENEQNA